MREFDSQIRETATERLKAIEGSLKTDVVLFFGPIVPAVKNQFRDMIENLKPDPAKENQETISVILQTPGGRAEIVEKLVEILRHHYKSVNFIIPDYAMSAGTLFALSGDKIYMDYSSSLGPIDPQVYNGTDLVPALGYLDQVKEMIQKSAEGKLTDVEALVLKGLDPAMLSKFEQARNLTITLLEKWLAEWPKHRSDPKKKGTPISDDEKKKRAKEISENLSDNKIWHSHERQISLKTLQTAPLWLEIKDYAEDRELQAKIRRYFEFIIPYVTRHGYTSFFHSRNLF